MNIRSVLLIGALLAVASPAMAGQIKVGYDGATFGPYQSGSGGEFTLGNSGEWLDLSDYASTTRNFGPVGLPSISSFQTFCIEKSEFIGGASTIYNAQLNTNAMGVSTPGGDPVSLGTGWLYSRFARGVLDYAYTGTVAERKASALQLQRAIWWLEGDERIDSLNPYIIEVLRAFGPSAQDDGGWIYGVSAVNLWRGDDPTKNTAQDQLFFSAVSVPDSGATLVLLGIALLALAILSPGNIAVRRRS